jgi:hypothetical protein
MSTSVLAHPTTTQHSTAHPDWTLVAQLPGASARRRLAARVVDAVSLHIVRPPALLLCRWCFTAPPDALPRCHQAVRAASGGGGRTGVCRDPCSRRPHEQMGLAARRASHYAPRNFSDVRLDSHGRLVRLRVAHRTAHTLATAPGLRPATEARPQLLRCFSLYADQRRCSVRTSLPRRPPSGRDGGRGPVRTCAEPRWRTLRCHVLGKLAAAVRFAQSLVSSEHWAKEETEMLRGKRVSVSSRKAKPPVPSLCPRRRRSASRACVRTNRSYQRLTDDAEQLGNRVPRLSVQREHLLLGLWQLRKLQFHLGRRQKCVCASRRGGAHVSAKHKAVRAGHNHSRRVLRAPRASTQPTHRRRPSAAQASARRRRPQRPRGRRRRRHRGRRRRRCPGRLHPILDRVPTWRWLSSAARRVPGC